MAAAKPFVVCALPREATFSTPARPKVCGGRGTLPSCTLCPKSKTYWRTTHAPAAANPWNGATDTPAAPTADPEGPADAYRYWPGRQSKDDSTVWTAGPEAFCVMNCGRKTRPRSPKGVPVHMSCAETYNREHNRRTNADTRLRPGRPGTIDGTGHDDTPVRRDGGN